MKHSSRPVRSNTGVLDIIGRYVAQATVGLAGFMAAVGPVLYVKGNM